MKANLKYYVVNTLLEWRYRIPDGYWFSAVTMAYWSERPSSRTSIKRILDKLVNTGALARRFVKRGCCWHYEYKVVDWENSSLIPF